MSTPPDNTVKVDSEGSPELRSQLLRRVLVAGGLVAVLLAVLAAFEHFSQPADTPEVRVFTEPVPVAPRKLVTQPVTPMAPVEEDAETPADSEADAPLADADSPLPPPEVAAEPSPASLPASRPARAASATAVAPAPAAAPAQDLTFAPPLAPKAPIAAPAQAVREAETPSARVIGTTPAAPAAPAAPRLFSGFLLQAGVFNSVQRAEELHARLTLSGVPSNIETRVQVGPFRTRKEAIEAQARLRELGIDSILVAPASAR